MSTVRTACPLDCWDCCALEVTVEGGRVVRVRGDRGVEVTQGFACPKAAYQLERMYSPHRLRHPLIRQGGELRRAAWGEALGLVAERLAAARAKPESVLAYTDAGNMGQLKRLEHRFWNAFGGPAMPVSSLCWAAGLAAQRLDFGGNRAHDPLDHKKSKLVLIWGRNPAATNVHLLPYIKHARLIVVDPLATATAAQAQLHLRPCPGTDGFLALGMASVILTEGLHSNTAADGTGFEAYRRLVAEWPVDKVAAVTGVQPKDIVLAARLYAAELPSTILIGYGVQRYANGGSSIRAIDALAALTGQIGVPGGGANYANTLIGETLADLAGPGGPSRRFVRARLAAELEAADPPIQVLVTTRSNPAAQLPDTGRSAAALAAVPFKVAVDLELTDTAALADVVLPCATPFEEEDLYYCSWHNYLTWGRAAVEALPECRSDLAIFAELARRLGFGDKLDRAPAEYIAEALAPAFPPGFDLLGLRGTTFRFPQAELVAWPHRLGTEDGKFHYLSGVSGPAEPANTEYPLVLLSPQHDRRLHSQFRERAEEGKSCLIRLSRAAATRHGMRQGERVRLSNERGWLVGDVRLDDRLPGDVVVVYNGNAVADRGQANYLTSMRLTDLGDGAAFYDCRCRIDKLGP